jgi:hypothetical protein
MKNFIKEQITNYGYQVEKHTIEILKGDLNYEKNN